MMHKKANPTLLKFYEYKQGLKSLSPEGEGFNQLGDYKQTAKDRIPKKILAVRMIAFQESTKEICNDWEKFIFILFKKYEF